MRHEMLTQRAPFCIDVMAKKGTLSQHFMTHVVPPLVAACSIRAHVSRNGTTSPKETNNGKHLPLSYYILHHQPIQSINNNIHTKPRFQPSPIKAGAGSIITYPINQ